MAKLNKDTIQKIIAGVLALAFAFYAYFAFLINPLSGKMAEAEVRIGELREKIKQADKQILKTNALEKDAVEAEDTMDLMEGYFPEGAPVAWFPPLVSGYFERQGLGKVAVKYAGSSGAGSEALDAYQRTSWDMQFLEVDFLKLGIALAGLENEEPFLEIDEIRIEQSPEDVGRQRVSLKANMLVLE